MKQVLCKFYVTDFPCFSELFYVSGYDWQWWFRDVGPSTKLPFSLRVNLAGACDDSDTGRDSSCNRYHLVREYKLVTNGLSDPQTVEVPLHYIAAKLDGRPSVRRDQLSSDWVCSRSTTSYVRIIKYNVMTLYELSTLSQRRLSLGWSLRLVGVGVLFVCCLYK